MNAPSDPVGQLIETIAKDKADALTQLKTWAKEPISLKRPVFFVPGWTDDINKGWTIPYSSVNTSMENWSDQIFSNSNLAYFINFSKEDSASCDSFLDFSKILRDRVRRLLGQAQDFDILGHSMGGLDIRGAVIDEKDPLLGINHCVLVAVPNEGSQWGDLCKAHMIRSSRNLTDAQVTQGVNMDPSHPIIQSLNHIELKRLFLKNINRLYTLRGWSDTAIFGSSRFQYSGMEAEFPGKVTEINYDGTTHTGRNGITQDPRVIAHIVRILLDLPLTEPLRNYGNVG